MGYTVHSENQHEQSYPLTPWDVLLGIGLVGFLLVGACLEVSFRFR